MPPYRIEWLDEAQADVSRLHRPTALRLFDGILHHAHSGGGHISPLHGNMADSFRLRLDKYRNLFMLRDDVMRIFGVRHRSEAFR